MGGRSRVSPRSRHATLSGWRPLPALLQSVQKGTLSAAHIALVRNDPLLNTSQPMLHVERLSNGSHDNAASTGQLDGAVVDDQIRQDAGVEIRDARIRFEVPAEGRTSSIEGLGRGLSTQNTRLKSPKDGLSDHTLLSRLMLHNAQ